MKVKLIKVMGSVGGGGRGRGYSKKQVKKVKLINVMDSVDTIHKMSKGVGLCDACLKYKLYIDFHFIFTY